MKKPKQRFLESKLKDMVEHINNTDHIETLKKHYNQKTYKDKDVDEFNSRLVVRAELGKKNKYTYGYQITYFVSENPFAADKHYTKKVI